MSSTPIKRYCDLPDVNIDPARVPRELIPVLQAAKDWAIMGDEALEQAVKKAGRAKIQEVLKLVLPLRAEIESFAYDSDGAKATPVPDEVVVFQMFAWSLRSLEVEVL